ncbi:unnamed protein product [Plutella xylostella]|uniref:(diamondback moth) hypothetical protein n=1 Tax=Plutella xylostella TaxID=51655 RepID=A0A8S4EPS0_PLUXY|nr:unnamed protein product [Plutella xylostella]
MSYNNNYNPSFYNNLTFQGNIRPPPNFSVPPPPHYGFPPQRSQPLSDQDIIKTFESKITPSNSRIKQKPVAISSVREHLRNIVLLLKQLQDKESLLKENISTMSEEEWGTAVDEIKQSKVLLDGLMLQINDTYLDVIKSALSKRSAKRLRLKRINEARKRQNMEMKKQWEERSRKIDEDLQKIKNDIDKAKQKEEFKIQADIILREVTRKKQDAKKCLSKLDALARLRKARQNTAKGRGMEVSESDAVSFSTNIDKLKSLWTQKLSLYEKEEAELRDKLQKDSEEKSMSECESQRRVAENLSKWRHYLFGTEENPQVDFKGNIEHFISVRFNWDQYINSEGSPIPVGWVVPPST